MPRLPDGRIRVLVQGMNRAQVDGFSQNDPFMLARLTPVEEEPWDEESLELQALRQHHMAHHYRTPDSRFGVSTTLWDRVFRS